MTETPKKRATKAELRARRYRDLLAVATEQDYADCAETLHRLQFHDKLTLAKRTQCEFGAAVLASTTNEAKP